MPGKTKNNQINLIRIVYKKLKPKKMRLSSSSKDKYTYHDFSDFIAPYQKLCFKCITYIVNVKSHQIQRGTIIALLQIERTI